MVRELRSARERAFDFETDGLRYASGKRPVGFSIGYLRSDGLPRAWYVPFGHRTAEPQIERANAQRAFEDAIDEADGLVGHNLKFDLLMARASGWRVSEFVPLHDTMIQAHMTYERRSLQLENVAASERATLWSDPLEAKNLVDQYTQHMAARYKLPWQKDDKKKRKASYLSRFGHSEVPIDLEGEYSCRDIAHTLLCDRAMRGRAMGIGTEIEAQRRWLYWNEMLLVRALAEMEWNGQYVNTDYLTELAATLDQDLEERQRDLALRFGVAIDFGNDGQVRDLLYRVLRLPVVKMTEGNRQGQGKVPAVDREALMALRKHHPGIEALAEFNVWSKVRSTYTDSMVWRVDHDGLIHCNFNQPGTVTGRLSSNDPNLQNIPSRHKEASKRIRKAWEIHNGVRLYCDYSQIELRVLAWATGCRNLVDSYRSRAYEAFLRGQITYDEYRWHRRTEPSTDVHANVAKGVFHIDETHPDWKRKRSAAKIVNFGVPYGGGWPLLAGNPEIGMDRSEAEAFVEQYHSGNPEIKSTKTRVFRSMRSKSGTPRFSNWCGRIVHAPEMRNPDEEVQAEGERSAFASLIQGSAGELTRISLVRMYLAMREGRFPARLVSTVHDEIALDCAKSDLPYVASEAQRMMEDFHGIFGSLPVVADLEVATTTWADKEDYDFWDTAAAA
jgi:DNA polymerase I-like protein with 3'-5' exonuclease and polymerase domains